MKMRTDTKKNKKTGVLLVLLAGILWGAMGVYVKFFTSRGLTSVDTALVRIGSAALLTTAWLALRDVSLLKIKLRDIWCFFGSGVCSLMFFSLCYFETIVQSSMAVASVLLYLAPIFVMLMSALFFKDRITARKCIAILLSIGGCVLVAGLIGSGDPISGKALVLGLCSAFGYALYSIFSKFALRRGYSSITVTAYTFIFAFTGLLFFADVRAVASLVTQSAGLGTMFLATGFMSALLPYAFYTKGLESVEAGKASVIASIEPVTASVISVVFYKEELSPLQAVGILCVLLSILLVDLPAKGRPRSC